MSVLTRCDGPECPNCGCKDVRIIAEPKVSNGQVSWWGSGRARCNHCRRMFSFREVKQVERAEVPVLDPQAVDAVFEELGETPPPVTEPPVQVERRVIATPKCPDCGGKTKVSSTRKSFRWHKCVQCGKTMKTAR